MRVKLHVKFLMKLAYQNGVQLCINVQPYAYHKIFFRCSNKEHILWILAKYFLKKNPLVFKEMPHGL